METNSMVLDWQGKDLVLVGDGDDAYRWCHPADLSEPTPIRDVAVVGDSDQDEPDGHIIVGDSFDALRSLNGHPFVSNHGGARLVYIDPPFNTGQTFAQYDDSLQTDVWLSMLRDRLVAVKPLLSASGSIWVHLDDAGQHLARCVLDEVFGTNAFVATVIWQKRSTRESRSAFSSAHDYIHVYAPAGPQQWKESRNLLNNDGRELRNRDSDPRGPWADAPFTAPGYRANQQYEIVNPAGDTLVPPKGRSWYATEPVFRKLLKENRIWFPRGGAGLPRIKMFPEHLRGLVPLSLWASEDCGTNDEAKRHLMAMFPDEEAFATPKPEALLERIIHIASDPGDLVIDFFAGSATTAAASHKMGRKWIAIERSPQTVQTYAIRRLAMVTQGKDTGGITSEYDWQGGGAFVVSAVGESRHPAIAKDLVVDAPPTVEQGLPDLEDTARLVPSGSVPTLFDS